MCDYASITPPATGVLGREFERWYVGRTAFARRYCLGMELFIGLRNFAVSGKLIHSGSGKGTKKSS